MKSYSEIAMMLVQYKEEQKISKPEWQASNRELIEEKIAALEWVLGLHDPAPAPEPDYGEELELTDFADDLEANVHDLVVQTLGPIEREDPEFQDALNTFIKTTMDELAELGEQYFGIPEMHTYPYTMFENEPVVLWSRDDTRIDVNLSGQPCWWIASEDFIGWGGGLAGAVVTTAKEYLFERDNGTLPRGTTCAVPLRDAEEMMKHY